MISVHLFEFVSDAFFKKLVSSLGTDRWPLKKNYFLHGVKLHPLNLLPWPLEPLTTISFKTDAVWR